MGYSNTSFYMEEKYSWYNSGLYSLSGSSDWVVTSGLVEAGNGGGESWQSVGGVRRFWSLVLQRTGWDTKELNYGTPWHTEITFNSTFLVHNNGIGRTELSTFTSNRWVYTLPDVKLQTNTSHFNIHTRVFKVYRAKIGNPVWRTSDLYQGISSFVPVREYVSLCGFGSIRPEKCSRRGDLNGPRMWLGR